MLCRAVPATAAFVPDAELLKLNDAAPAPPETAFSSSSFSSMMISMRFPLSQSVECAEWQRGAWRPRLRQLRAQPCRLCPLASTSHPGACKPEAAPKAGLRGNRISSLTRGFLDKSMRGGRETYLIQVHRPDTPANSRGSDAFRLSKGPRRSQVRRGTRRGDNRRVGSRLRNQIFAKISICLLIV